MKNIPLMNFFGHHFVIMLINGASEAPQQYNVFYLKQLKMFQQYTI